LEVSVVVEDGELDRIPGRVQTHGKLRLTLGVGDPDELPPVGGRSPVPEGGHEAELLRKSLIENPECGHDEVGGGVYPVGRLEPVGAPDPSNSGVAVKVNIEFKLSDKVK